LPTFDGAASLGIIGGLSEMAHIYTRRSTWLDENQKKNILKIAANSYRAVVIRSKAGAHRSLVREKMSHHKIRGIYKI